MILSLVHIKMEFVLLQPFEYLLKRIFEADVKIPIPGGRKSAHTRKPFFAIFSPFNRPHLRCESRDFGRAFEEPITEPTLRRDLLCSAIWFMG